MSGTVFWLSVRLSGLWLDKVSKTFTVLGLQLHSHTHKDQRNKREMGFGDANQMSCISFLLLCWRTLCHPVCLFDSKWEWRMHDLQRLKLDWKNSFMRYLLLPTHVFLQIIFPLDQNFAIWKAKKWRIGIHFVKSRSTIYFDHIWLA